MPIGIKADSGPHMELVHLFHFSHVAGKVVGSLYFSRKYRSPTAMLSLQESDQAKKEVLLPYPHCPALS